MFVVWCFTINFLKCSNVYHEQAPSPSPPSTSIFAYFMRKYVVKFAHFHAVPICFVLFRFGCAMRIYVYIRFDGSEKIRKCYDLTFPESHRWEIEISNVDFGHEDTLAYTAKENEWERTHTRALKLQSDIYWQNAYAFMCRIGMNHSLQEIWKFTTGNTSTNENTENKASTTMASSKENANSIKSPKSQLSL